MGGSAAKQWDYDEVPDYIPMTNGYRVWMFGDSILDNSYWNGVEGNFTSECLKKMLPNVEVKDRSTEELDGMSMINALNSGRTINVRYQYVQHRNELGLPYDEAPRGHVQIDPEFGPKDFVVISVGGNDFALRHEMDPTVILGFVRQIIQYYKERGVEPHRMIYFTPYSLTGIMKFAVALTCRNLNSLYAQLLEEAEQMCQEEGITCIKLDSFTGEERANPGTGIPEPTPYGAWRLAKLIQEPVLKQIEKEEGEVKGGRPDTMH